MTVKKLYKTETRAYRDRFIGFIHTLQDKICHALETLDGKAKFISEEWERKGGGGGLTRVAADGQAIEKGGVNNSVVWSHVSDKMRSFLETDASRWFACGLSLVLHPQNPYAPTVHANWRYFELWDAEDYVMDRWFGGGSDLTPYYLFEEDARHFHRTLQTAIDPFGADLYPDYKRRCDDYFVNRHRQDERRGIGGVFYDHIRFLDEEDAERWLSFQQAVAGSFLPAYLPILERRKDTPFGEREKEWQEIRRGRYVEFNLLHDRGTLFGLKSHGRTESILMSLPPRARWVYDFQPPTGSPEAELLDACLHPKDWI